MPSRNDMSWRVRCFPCKFMIGSPLCRHRGQRQFTGQHFLREHFGGAGCGGGHDVKVAGILRQKIAKSFDFHKNRYTLTIKYRTVFERVAGHIFLHFCQHAMYRFCDRLLVGFIFGQAMNSVAHGLMPRKNFLLGSVPSPHQVSWPMGPCSVHWQ